MVDWNNFEESLNSLSLCNFDQSLKKKYSRVLIVVVLAVVLFSNLLLAMTYECACSCFFIILVPSCNN